MSRKADTRVVTRSFATKSMSDMGLPICARALAERMRSDVACTAVAHHRVMCANSARVTNLTGLASDFADILRSQRTVSTLVLDLKNGKPVERRGRKATGLTDCL